MIDRTQTVSRPSHFRSGWSAAGISCMLFASTLAISAQAVTPAAPVLSPQPREIQPGALAPIHIASVLVPGADPDDLFAAQNLTQSLTQSGLRIAPAADLTIHLLRTDSPQARQLLSANHLAFDAPMHDEGYILLSRKNPITGETVDIIGQTSAGIFYGAQTLKQLIEPSKTGPQLWTATIRDWPAMKYRGQHDDLSRGPFPTLSFQKSSPRTRSISTRPTSRAISSTPPTPSPHLPAAPSPATKPKNS